MVQNTRKTQTRTTIWIGGSKLDTENARTAIIWFDKRLIKWYIKCHYLKENKNSFNTNLWAISDTLELKIKETRNRNSIIIINFIDS